MCADLCNDCQRVCETHFN
ncbi:hypothetical protein [Staphylococcus aureus]